MSEGLLDILIAYSKDTGEDMQRYIDDLSETSAESRGSRRAIYLGIPSTDCYPYFRCPLCGVNFRGTAVYVDRRGKTVLPEVQTAAGWAVRR